LYLWRLDLSAGLGHRSAEGTLHKATESEMDVMAEAHRDPELVKRRLDAGHEAYWLECDGACVSIAWYATGKYFVWDIRSELLVPLDSLYLFDIFTVPEFRRKGLFRSCLLMSLEVHKCGGGVREVYALTRTDNVPANTCFRRLGFDRVATVSLLQIPPVRCYRLAHENGKRSSLLRLMNVRTKPAVLNLEDLRFVR